MNGRIATAAAFGLAVAGGLCAALRAQPTRSVWDGVYTDEQAKRGAVLFDRECASCHGPAGAGGDVAPALVGAAFAANYDGQTVGDLFDRSRRTMPPGKEGTLTRQQGADILAYVLQCNGFPAGPSELPSQTQGLSQIKYLATKPGLGPPSASLGQRHLLLTNAAFVAGRDGLLRGPSTRDGPAVIARVKGPG